MNIEMIAAAEPTATALKDFLQVVAYLVVLGVAMKTLLARKPGYGDLATKAELEKKADQKDLDRIEKEVKQLEVDLGITERRIITEIKESGSKVSEELKNFADEARKGRVALWEKVNEKVDKEDLK